MNTNEFIDWIEKGKAIKQVKNTDKFRCISARLHENRDFIFHLISRNELEESYMFYRHWLEHQVAQNGLSLNALQDVIEAELRENVHPNFWEGE